MLIFPAALQNLSDQFARLPGIGGKSAQRLAFHVLSLTEAEAQEFADAIVSAKKNVTCCPVCQNLTAGGLCSICASPKRDSSTVCVVADPRDVMAIERSREYNGLYHVLHGVISPMNHVGPDDLEIKSLLERVSKGDISEIIMATNPDTEGEATAMYLARLLKPFDVRVTRLAYGIPVGGHLEFADDANFGNIDEIYEYANDHGYKFICLTASTEKGIKHWQNITGAEYPFYLTDETTLKTVIRSNPGLLLLKDGTIIQKWSHNDLPNMTEIAGKPLEQTEIGKMPEVSAAKKIAGMVSWFVIPLVLLTIADRLWAWGAWIRKKENSNRILSTFKKKRKMR